MYVVGHRGAAGVVPENTLKGFDYAIKLGVDYVECDVHLTFDKQLVVMHDATVNRTTNGIGAIANLTFDTVRSLDAGEGERVPTLDEVLDLVKGKVQLLCELKGEGVEADTVTAVKNHGLENDVAFTCFQTQRIENVKRIDNRLQIGAILPNPTEDDIQHASNIGASGIGVQFKNVCFRVVEQAFQRGLDIRAWNPDTLGEQQAMIALGVSGICSNRPDMLIEHLKQEGLKS